MRKINSSKGFGHILLALILLVLVVVGLAGYIVYKKSQAQHVPTSQTVGTTAGAIQTFPTPSANSKPQSIIKGSDGNMWFSETDANKIGRITPAGKITEFLIPTAHANPYKLTLGSDGNIWFTEGIKQNSKLADITPAGKITEYPIPTVTADTGPGALAFGADGNIWFCSGYDVANWITRFTVTTKTFTNFTVPNLDSTNGPLVLGADGNIWFPGITKDGGSATQLFSMDSSGETTLHAVATQDNVGQDAGPWDLVATPQGVWYTEFNSSSLGFYSYGGKASQLSWLKDGDSAMYSTSSASLTSDSNGNLWVAGSANTQDIFKVDPATKQYAAYDLPAGDTFPADVATGPNNTLWYTDINANVVGVLHIDRLSK